MKNKEFKKLNCNWAKFINESRFPKPQVGYGLIKEADSFFGDIMQSALAGKTGIEDVGGQSTLNTHTQSDSTEAQHPLKGAGRFSSPMGDKGSRRFSHNGQDISAPVGTNIYPLAEGVVVSVRSQEEFIQKSMSALKNAKANGLKIPGLINNDIRLIDYKHPDIQGATEGCPISSYRWVQKAFQAGGFKAWKEGGIWVMIKHPGLKKDDKEITAWYAHLHELNVSEGDSVDKNTIIGTVGRSGVVCDQPHLHLEMFTGENRAGVSGRVIAGVLVDPRGFI